MSVKIAYSRFVARWWRSRGAGFACRSVRAVSSAQAIGEAKPLRITKFTMQTTEADRRSRSATKVTGLNNRSVSVHAGRWPSVGADDDRSNSTTEEFYNGSAKTYYPCRRAIRRTWCRICRRGCWVTRRLCRAARLTGCAAQGRTVPGGHAGRCVGHHLRGGAGLIGPDRERDARSGPVGGVRARERRGDRHAVLTAHRACAPPAGYGFTVVSNEIPTLGSRAWNSTFWGVPADPSHDPDAGTVLREELRRQPAGLDGGGENGGYPAVPFLVPTDCSGGPEHGDDARRLVGGTGERASADQSRLVRVTGREDVSGTTMPGVTGCNLLAFEPEIEVQPDTLLADEPVGLGVNVHGARRSRTRSAWRRRICADAVVTLPEGMSISPGIVDGIQACNESGPEGINFNGPESEEVGLNGEPQLAAGHCPDASTVGTAEAITPLLAEPVKGHVYLARPGAAARGRALHRSRTRSTGTFTSSIWNWAARVRSRTRASISRSPARSRRTPRRGS